MTVQRRGWTLRKALMLGMVPGMLLALEPQAVSQTTAQTSTQATATPRAAPAVTLDTLFARVRQCQFGNFYYAPWDTSQPVHPYFTQRGLEPYREEEGLYYFKIRDTLFGLPVVALFVPGTWDFHGVVFDVPLNTARQVMQQRFGSTFRESRRTREGEAPMLVAYKDNPTQQSVLACAERPYRQK